MKGVTNYTMDILLHYLLGSSPVLTSETTQREVSVRQQILSGTVRQYLLLPSQATIFTLSTRANSCTSRNSTSFNISVQTLSQNRYVFSLAALKVTRDFTRLESAALIDLSNCTKTRTASCGVIWPYCNKSERRWLARIAIWECYHMEGFFVPHSLPTWISSSKLSCKVLPRVVFRYSWYVMVILYAIVLILFYDEILDDEARVLDFTKWSSLAER